MRGLHKVAQNEQTTASAIIRSFLAEKLDPRSKAAKKRSTSLTTFARRLRTLGRPGPKDLARNLDRYLYGR